MMVLISVAIIMWYVSATALSHRTYPSFISAMSSSYVRSLLEMCAARDRYGSDRVCCCAAHTVSALPVAPQMFRCRGGDLSRAHTVGRPTCTPRQRVNTRESFFWVDVISLCIAIGWLPLFLPLRDAGFCGLTHERLGC